MRGTTSVTQWKNSFYFRIHLLQRQRLFLSASKNSQINGKNKSFSTQNMLHMYNDMNFLQMKSGEF